LLGEIGELLHFAAVDRLEQRLARLERKSPGGLLAPGAAESRQDSDESNPDRPKGEKFHAGTG